MANKNEVNPKWAPLAQKLKNASDSLDNAAKHHEQAFNDARLILDNAEKALLDAITSARALVREVGEIPPGEYPAITDKK